MTRGVAVVSWSSAVMYMYPRIVSTAWYSFRITGSGAWVTKWAADDGCETVSGVS